MELPNNHMILLSVVNTNLRDYYSTLDKLCDDMNINKEVIIRKLNEIDYKYDKKLNRFI